MRLFKKSGKPAKAALARVTKLVARINSLLENLETRDFTLVQKPFLWPIAFPDVLRAGDANSGFDIVLANPPYVRMEKIDNEDEQAYWEAFPEVRASPRRPAGLFLCPRSANPKAWRLAGLHHQQLIHQAKVRRGIAGPFG